MSSNFYPHVQLGFHQHTHTHTCESKISELSSTANIQLHGAILLVSIPPLSPTIHTSSLNFLSHVEAANSPIIAYLLFSDCCLQPDLCSQVKVQLEKISFLFRSILFLICCCCTKFPAGVLLLPIAFPLLL